MLRKVFKNLIASLTILIIFTVILNYVSGFWFKKEISRVKWADDHIVKLRMSKNPLIMFEIIPDVGEANSQGLRDFEYPIKKPRGTYRIAVIGDSVAYGFGIEIEETFAKQLEEKLNIYTRNKKYEVINFSVPAYSTIQESEVLRSKVLRYNPDFIIIAAHTNDCQIYSSDMDQIFSYDTSKDDFNLESFLFNPQLNEIKRKIYSTNLARCFRYSWACFKKLYKNKRMKSSLEKKDANISRISDYYANIDILELGLSKIAKIVKKHNLPSIVTYSPMIGEQKGGLSNGIREICKRKGLDFLDVSDTLLSYPKDDIFVDVNSHLTPYGHMLYMEEIYQHIKPLLPLFAKLK